MFGPTLAVAAAAALIAAASPALAQTRPDGPAAPALNPGDNAPSGTIPKDATEVAPDRLSAPRGHSTSSSMPPSRMPVTRLPSSHLPFGPNGPTGTVPGPNPATPAPGEPTEIKRPANSAVRTFYSRAFRSVAKVA